MPSALQTGSTIGSTGLGIALPLLGVSAGVAAPVAAAAGLVSLLGKIGVGRKTANEMTGNGGPQAVINSQLQTIANDPNTTVTQKAQATAVAWTNFLQSANTFASNTNLPGGGEDAALVAWQAINQTPGLTNTVSSLLSPLGLNAFSSQFKQVSPLIGASKPAKGSALNFSDFIPAITGAASAIVTSAINGTLNPNTNVSGGSTSGASGNSVAPAAPSSGQGTWTDPSSGINYNWSDSLGGWQAEDGSASLAPGQSTNSGFVGPLDPNNPQSGSTSSTNPANQGGSSTSSNTSTSSSLLNSIFGKNPLSSLLSTAGLITNGILQSNAANNAASLQAGAANNAAQLDAQTAQDVLNFEKQVYANEQTANAPYLAAGQNALSQIQSYLSGPGSQPFVAPTNPNPTTFTLPTEQQAEQTPGFQFELDQALKALGPTTKGVLSGNTINAAETQAKNLASADYSNLVNQQLSAFNANQNAYQNQYNNALNAFQTNRNNTLQPLMTLAGYGSQAVNANTTAGSNAEQSVGSTETNAANNIGNLGQQAAAATAQGVSGSTNATTNAITGITNNLTGNNAMNAVLQALGLQSLQNNQNLMNSLRASS